MKKTLPNLIKQISLIKNLVNRMYSYPYIDFRFDFWFEVNTYPRFGITKNITGLPYIDFFDVIGFNTDKIYIVDFFYSIKDVLLDKHLPQSLLKEIIDNKFWKDEEKIISLMPKYPDVFKDHIEKKKVIESIHNKMGKDWLAVDTTIEDGMSLTRMLIRYGKTERDTIERVLLCLKLLKDTYEKIYNVDIADHIDSEQRKQNYKKLMEFLNIAAHIVRRGTNRTELSLLYLHPIYYSNEVIIELYATTNDEEKRYVLSLIDSQYEISHLEGETFRCTTLYEAIDKFLELLSKND